MIVSSKDFRYRWKENELETMRGDLQRSEDKRKELEAALEVLARIIDKTPLCPFTDSKRCREKDIGHDCIKCLTDYAVIQARRNIKRRKR